MSHEIARMQAALGINYQNGDMPSPVYRSPVVAPAAAAIDTASASTPTSPPTPPPLPSTSAASINPQSSNYQFTLPNGMVPRIVDGILTLGEQVGSAAPGGTIIMSTDIRTEQQQKAADRRTLAKAAKPKKAPPPKTKAATKKPTAKKTTAKSAPAKASKANAASKRVAQAKSVAPVRENVPPVETSLAAGRERRVIKAAPRRDASPVRTNDTAKAKAGKAKGRTAKAGNA